MYRLYSFSRAPLPFAHDHPILNESTALIDVYEMFPDPDDMDYFPG